MALTSVWQHGAREPSPPSSVDGDYDVAVVGGGITGLTTALLLGRAGRRVLLIEARRWKALRSAGWDTASPLTSPALSAPRRGGVGDPRVQVSQWTA